MVNDTSIAASTALIRRCSICDTVNAIDLDNTPAHYAEMRKEYCIIEMVSKDEAKRLWNAAKRCECGKRTKSTDAEHERLMNQYAAKRQV